MPKHSVSRPRSHSLASYLQERLSIKRTFGLYQPFERLQAQTMDLADSTEVFLDRFASGVSIDTASNKNESSQREGKASQHKENTSRRQGQMNE